MRWRDAEGRGLRRAELCRQRVEGRRLFFSWVTSSSCRRNCTVAAPLLSEGKAYDTDDHHVMPLARAALCSVDLSLVDSAKTLTTTIPSISILPTNPIPTCTGESLRICYAFSSCMWAYQSFDAGARGMPKDGGCTSQSYFSRSPGNEGFFFPMGNRPLAAGIIARRQYRLVSTLSISLLGLRHGRAPRNAAC